MKLHADQWYAITSYVKVPEDVEMTNDQFMHGLARALGGVIDTVGFKVAPDNANVIMATRIDTRVQAEIVKLPPPKVARRKTRKKRGET